MVFTDGELAYLRSQRLGRLATLAPDGTLQNNPVGFSVDEQAGVIDIGGLNLGETRKFRNVAANDQVAFVVDDIASVDPWVVRCFEVRGTAGDQDPSQANHQLGHGPGRLREFAADHRLRSGRASRRRRG